MRLAWRNLLHDRTRFAVTVVGVGFAVFLMLFQGSLLAGFLGAASAVVDAAGGDLWVAARGVPCFDFPAPLPERYRAMALGVAGVDSARRLATDFGDWLTPEGTHKSVIVVGAEPGGPVRLPAPASSMALPDSVLVDESDLRQLGLRGVPAEVEISSLRARVAGTVSGFGSFLGAPYVFASYADALRFARVPPERTTFLVLGVSPGRDARAVREALRERLPEADIWTGAEFSRRSRTFWIFQTGAGGAILTAGILGFIVGVVIVSQTLYAMTMENIEEFATLKAMGAPAGYIRRLVLFQAAASGLLGYALGLAACLPSLAAVRGAIPWVRTPWHLPLLVLAASLIMSGVAALVSIRRAVTVEPGRVFRA